jgi:CRP-like cAMP-binding protein
MSQPLASIQNQILAHLPESEYQRLLPHLETVDLPHGKILYEIGETIKHVYFPSNAMISLVTQMSDGKIVEVGLVGKDGMAGITAVMGGMASGDRAIVQIPDGGIRVKVGVIQEEFKRGEALQRNLLGYANGLMRQVSQTAACNASHTTEERLSRWLLMCHDRVNSAELNLTQEFIAEMLGTRRATVNVAAITLQSAQLIKYNRGHITIVDRPGLEAFSCECYANVKTAINGDGQDGRH